MSTVRVRDDCGSTDYATLETQRRELSRRVLSLICSTTGRQRTPDERARLEALVQEIDRVRHDLRDASIARTN
jgi:hypothetical protein